MNKTHARINRIAGLIVLWLLFVTCNAAQTTTSSQDISLPVAVKIDPAILKGQVGRYELPPEVAPHFILDVTLENDELFLKPSHQESRQLAAISATEFFDVNEPDRRLEFQKDDKGNVTGVAVKGVGPSFTARKLILPPPSLTGNTTFSLKGHPNAKIVALAGTFNNRNQSQTLFAREGDDWVCRIDLVPGKHAYKFVIDGNWITDPSHPNTEDDGQGNIKSVLVKEK